MGSRNNIANHASARTSSSDLDESRKRPEKWTMGMLNDRETDEVPGKSSLRTHNIAP